MRNIPLPMAPSKASVRARAEPSLHLAWPSRASYTSSLSSCCPSGEGTPSASSWRGFLTEPKQTGSSRFQTTRWLNGTLPMTNMGISLRRRILIVLFNPALQRRLIKWGLPSRFPSFTFVPLSCMYYHNIFRDRPRSFNKAWRTPHAPCDQIPHH